MKDTNSQGSHVGIHHNENDPRVIAQKIDAAANNGINAFIFDWYYYDEDLSGLTDPIPGHWEGSKYLYQALENGFLKATNKYSD